MRRVTIAILIALGATAAAAAPVRAAEEPQADVPQLIEIGQLLPGFDRLKPGVRRYLRHRVTGETWRAIDIWMREIRIERRDRARRLHIVQQWTGPVSAPHTLTLDSWFEIGTFRPLTHERRFERGEERRNEGFRFLRDRIVALDSTPANIDAKLDVAMSEPAFNFETDLELLQTLPLKAGYAASINLYHPGGAPPARYVFRVADSERLPGPGGEKIDCWVVTTDYNVPGAKPARFWLSKQDQTVLKVEQPQPDGSTVVKTLLY